MTRKKRSRAPAAPVAPRGKSLALRASPELLSALPAFALSLRMAGESRFFPAQLPGLTTEQCKELGHILSAISHGENARTVFRQDERRKPSTGNSFSIALVYYYLRATGYGNADALEVVRNAKSLAAPEDVSTIQRYARMQRDGVLDLLERSARSPKEAWQAQLFVHALLRPEAEFYVGRADEFAADPAVHALVDAVVSPLTEKDVKNLRARLAEKRREGVEA